MKTQTNLPTTKVVVQTDFEENAQKNCCMSQETTKAAIQTDSMITHDSKNQIEETSPYVPLVREVVIIKLHNELTKT